MPSNRKKNEANLLYDYKVNKYGIASYHNGKKTVSLYCYGYSIKKNIKQETRIYVEVLFNEKSPSGKRKKMALLLDQVMAASFDQDFIEGESALHIDYLNRSRYDCSWTNLCCFYNMKKLQQHYIEKTCDYYMMDPRVCCYPGLEDGERYLISSEGPVFSLHSFLWLTRAETEKLKLMSYKEVVLHSKGKQ